MGETAHEIVLEGANAPGHVATSEILSEGEARVVAIAGFLAEVRLMVNGNPIVMDDPASSLDHVYTRGIARRLAREAKERQVILFTHNFSSVPTLVE